MSRFEILNTVDERDVPVGVIINAHSYTESDAAIVEKHLNARNDPRYIQLNEEQRAKLDEKIADVLQMFTVKIIIEAETEKAVKLVIEGREADVVREESHWVPKSQIFVITDNVVIMKHSVAKKVGLLWHGIEFLSRRNDIPSLKDEAMRKWAEEFDNSIEYQCVPKKLVVE